MKPARTPKGSPFARNMIGGGGIVPCRDAPAYIAERRSLIAGVAIYMAIGLLALILAAVCLGWAR